MTALPDAVPAAIAAPPDLSVALPPGAERLTWERERVHFPHQVATLEGEYLALTIGEGMSHGLRHYEAPLDALKVLVLGGYVYNAFVPAAGEPEELEERGRRGEAALMAAVGNLRQRWEGDWLPEILEHLAAMEALDLGRASMTELRAHLADVRARALRLWQIHFEIVLPAYIAVSEFDELYRDLLGGDGFDAYRLLQGLDSRTFEVGRDLWRLSRVAAASPEVAAVLASTPAAEVRGALGASAEGRAFLESLQAHLEAYGHRSASWGIGSPGFLEDPTPVIGMLKDYARQPDEADPAREQARLAGEREQAIAEARERLQGYPAPVRAQFEALLEAAQIGYVLTEDHGFYIDAYSTDLARQLFMELGRRFAAAGAIDAAEDVLLLTLEEVDATAERPADRRAAVAERRAGLAAHAGATAPALLGAIPPGPPPVSPLTRFVGKFMGGPPVASEDGVVHGSAGSPGTATGVARVVSSLADAERLQAGEVLVAESTAPPWTPLFAVAAAVVTDTGGILSHSAVVAREYGLPAVVGTAVATIAVRDGDLVEVDGDAGTVRVLA